jgi:hypothetical protein
LILGAAHALSDEIAAIFEFLGYSDHLDSSIALPPPRRPPTPAFASRHRTSFIHHQRPPQQILAVARIHRALCGCVVIDFDKPKPPRLTRETIAHHCHGIDRHAIIGKEVL